MFKCKHDKERLWETQEEDDESGGTLHVYLRCSKCQIVLTHHIHEAW